MKDSQKKKTLQKKKKNNSRHHLLLLVSDYFDQAKKKFVFIIVSITILNLILGIVIVYLIGQIGQNMTQRTYPQISIPELPIFSPDTTIEVSADALMVFEKDSRTVVFQKNGSLRFSPASTTKIMTALVALDYYDINQYLVANGVWQVKGSNMGLVEGEEMKVHDLLYGLMLPSGNDAAYVLASNYPGGTNAFIKKMNEKAQELKLYNTMFFDPAGLDDRNYTTAFDLARLALVGLQNELLRTIVRTQYITVYDKSYMNVHTLENLNRLLRTPGVFGVKTGYTEEAGQVLVTSIDSKGKTYIIVVLKSADRFADTETVLKDVIEKIQLERF